jgi:predicted nucleic acid-binding protein
LSVEEAVAIVDDWLAQPNVDVLAEGDHHWARLRQTLVEGQAVGPLVSDAHLAALAIEHGAALATTDRDFARFAGLKTLNPLRTS